MEWVLQVADELDDAVGALRFGGSALIAELGVLLLAGLGVVAEIAGPAVGAQPALLKSRRDRRA